MIGPAMAERMKLKFKDVVELEFNGKKTKGAIWIQAGHPDNSVTVFFGYGRMKAGRIGTGQGFPRIPAAHQSGSLVCQRSKTDSHR